MSILVTHTKDSAPAASRPILAQAEAAFGFVPNLVGMLAESPAAAAAYLRLDELFGRSSLSAEEQQVVLLSVAVENRCHYCVAAHTTVAGMKKVPSAVVEAVRGGAPIPDPRLEALHHFATLVVRQRGWVQDGDVRAFLAAGFTRENVLDVILGVSMKTLSTYANHVAETPLDAAFRPAAWETRAA
jgi:uncharacterized peroxidase-related enzyme